MNKPVRRSLRIVDGTISYLEWEAVPTAPLLVFSHANGFNASTYKALLEPLAGRFRIIAWDMRGHGLTALPTDSATLRGWRVFRDDLLRLLAGLDVTPTVLAGHSLGATTSLLAAAEQPDIAASLVLAEPVMAADSVAWKARFAELIGRSDKTVPLVAMALKRRAQFKSREDAVRSFTGRGAFRTWTPQVVADYVETGLLPEGEGFRLACSAQWEAAAFAVFPFRLGRLGARIAQPVTMLCGTVHSSATPSVRDEFMRRHGHTRLVRVEGASHFLPMEYPDVLRTEILRAAGFAAS